MLIPKSLTSTTKMTCCEWAWSAREDVCIVYFTSRGVYPQGCVKILQLLCKSNRHFSCLGQRLDTLLEANFLYCVKRQAFLYDRIGEWIESQDVASFLFRLRFTSNVLKVVQAVSSYFHIAGTQTNETD